MKHFTSSFFRSFSVIFLRSFMDNSWFLFPDRGNPGVLCGHAGLLSPRPGGSSGSRYQIVCYQIVSYQSVSYQIGVTKNPPVVPIINRVHYSSSSKSFFPHHRKILTIAQRNFTDGRLNY